LAAGTLIFLLLGIIYSWSVFVAPLEKAFGWKRDATSLVYVVSICCFVIGSILSGPLIQRFATRTVIVISAAMLSSGFFMSSRVHSVWHLYLSYGVLCGLGIGVAYTAVLFAVMGRYGDKPGLASGVLLMGFGLGGFILGPAVTAVIYGPVGWRATYVLLGFVFGAVLTAGSFFVSLPPAPGAAAPGPSSSTADFSPGRVIRSRSYRWYLSWVVLVATNGMAVLSMGAPLALDIGASPMGAAVAAGVLSMGNGMGRLLFGHLFDRHGRPAAMLTASVFFAAAAVGVLTAYSRSSYLLLLAAFLATGISYGSTPILNSCFSRSVYGEKFLKYNLGIINLGYLVSAPLGAYGAGIV
jgi:OFA family oxalate/formate antiporter-like MFS transporter